MIWLTRSESKILWSRMSLVVMTGLLLTILPMLHFVASDRFDWPHLVGDRTEAVFDLWSFQHFCSGILTGTLLLSRLGQVRKFLLLLLVFALTWEAVELSMEAGLWGEGVAHWKRGFEHWGNRFVGDPAMVYLGGIFARRWPSVWKWVVLPALLWLCLNIFSPSSMSIQEWLFKP